MDSLNILGAMLVLCLTRSYVVSSQPITYYTFVSVPWAHYGPSRILTRSVNLALDTLGSPMNGRMGNVCVTVYVYVWGVRLQFPKL